MKRPIFIGPIGCGKTTLMQRLSDITIEYNKTQAVEFFNNMIDTPGEYLEHRQLFSSLSMTAIDADVIVLLQSATDTRLLYPQGFTTMFSKPVIGVVTKIDEARDQGAIDYASQLLTAAGASRIIPLSSMTGEHVAELEQALDMA